MNVDFEGVEDKFTRLYIAADESGAGARKKETVARFTTSVRCPACDGTRLNEAARTAQVDGHTLPQIVALPLTDLHALLPTLRTDAVGPLVDEAVAHADWVIDLGPDGGDAGGAVVFTGTPAELCTAPGSHTGAHLARHVTA